ncbi:PTS sugar transporter subunit IIC [Clostridium folliculivorans]|uniref:Permease IIC component n=1 Tax=Clostridium folliculivorans TaxID=2886038 RepID=A0A9W6DBZ6_9CLOT|nr:PTS sugar transporter subunit IIC [Clostridium folliculivorans]GKU26223.1 permease IIC component [Clostridium folliculivorans]GKU31895.1 permease IIC component [Clostridium folliculivorans]
MEQAKFSDKMISAVMKFVNLKAIVALKDGVMYTLPLSLCGSVFLLLAQIPYQPFNDWMASIFGSGWTVPLLQIYNASFGIMAMAAAVGIGYAYAKNEKHEPLSAGILSLVVFLGLNNFSVTTDKGVTVSNVIDKSWTGGQGMVTAIIVGLVVGAVYSWFLTKKITIKLPESVPQGVANQFSALIPGIVILLGTMIVYMFFRYALNTTFIGWIYKVLQTPLQGLTDSLPGVIILTAAVPFLWWFGVHGAMIVGGVTGSLYTANELANQALITSGKELTIANGAHIMTPQFGALFVTVTGSGLTVGLVIAALLAAKSEQSKALGKIAIWPAIFNINEPIIFGFPIVMNPFMFLPFVLVPVVSAVVTYFAIKIGFLHPFSAVEVPWTTPPIISGFILQGVKGALWQIVVIAWSTIAYYPFFKKQDALNYKMEHEEELV